MQCTGWTVLDRIIIFTVILNHHHHPLPLSLSLSSMANLRPALALTLLLCAIAVHTPAASAASPQQQQQQQGRNRNRDRGSPTHAPQSLHQAKQYHANAAARAAATMRSRGHTVRQFARGIGQAQGAEVARSWS